MPHRVVYGLGEAQCCKRPASIPKGRSYGTKALGLSFERKVGEALGKRGLLVNAGQWFSYHDANGHGYCQTDYLLFLPEFTVIVECKLTETQQGRKQIAELYAPVVSKVFGKPVAGIVVTRHLTRDTEAALVTGSINDALGYIAQAGAKYMPTLHWIGKGPI